jgi:hypothetical protein
MIYVSRDLCSTKYYLDQIFYKKAEDQRDNL